MLDLKKPCTPGSERQVRALPNFRADRILCGHRWRLLSRGQPAESTTRGTSRAPENRGHTSATSKPQYRLRDDVALNLVRSTVDRDLAIVEVHRRRLGRVIRPDHFLIPSVEV